jgi:putative DNA primase/helicase
MMSSGDGEKAAPVSFEQGYQQWILKNQPEYSDDQLASGFSRSLGAKYLFVATEGKWYVRGDKKYDLDIKLSIYAEIRRHLREVACVIKDPSASGRSPLLDSEKTRDRLARHVSSAKTVAAVERLARSDPIHARDAAEFDRDPWLINTPDFVVDLRTGETRVRTDQDLFRMCTACTPADIGYPLFDGFLHRILGGDVDVIDYVQRVFGYCLTGITREHAFWFFFGVGANGKSVLLNTIQRLMGDYACVIPGDLLVEARGERHPTELAMLQGRRLAIAAEFSNDRKLNGERVKSLTAGDPQTARFMRQDYFTFSPQAKFICAGNHRPKLRRVDEGVRRRINLLNFGVTIPAGERDKELAARLEKEWPAILRWALQGCLAWQRADGLNPPLPVQKASRDYIKGQDVLGQWIDEEIILDASARAGTKELHANYQHWITKRGEHPLGEKSFSQDLEDLGYERCEKAEDARGKEVRGFIGLKLKK